MKRSYSSASSHASFITADSEVENEPTRHLDSLQRQVSPPPTKARKKESHQSSLKASNSGIDVEVGSKFGKALLNEPQVKTAAVEAGRVDVEDHVSFFSEKLLAARRLSELGRPQLDHTQWLNLYQCNLTDEGHHFVVHQHDHPVAGTHYDLRLQINATSSISFAIMYGLPGDPNSKRLNRNATETRVHCLWNHLIETASHMTGTILIWDTGEYEVLPYYEEQRNQQDSDSEPSSPQVEKFSTDNGFGSLSEPAKLALCFSRRKIRLRLHGTQLPPGYTIGMRLTTDNDRSVQPRAPSFKRRRTGQTSQPKPRQRGDSSPERSSDDSTATLNSTHRRYRRTVSSLHKTESPPNRTPQPEPAKPSSSTSAHPMLDDAHANANAHANASENEESGVDPETIRLTNAYPSANNTVNSIHQRKWYLSLDRFNSGFKPVATPKHIDHHAKTYWVPKDSVSGFERFHVLGREVETSVVTGRLAKDILEDEGVEGYVPRGRWRGVVE
jgi:hypothetical protein